MSTVAATSGLDGPIGRTRTAIEASATAVITVALSMLVFGPILGSFGAPWGGGDMTQVYLQNTLWSGLGYGFTTQYAFPYGMEANAFAGLDLLPNVFAHTAYAVAGNAFLGMNLLLFLSFPIVAVLAYAAIRMVGLAGPLAVSLAVAFTFIPFHFGRGLGHVYLGLIFSLVTGLILALLVGSGRFNQWMVHPNGRRRIGYVAVTALLLVVTAWSGLYYAVFAVLLLASALIWRFAQGDHRRSCTVAASPLVGLVVLIMVGLVPVLVSRASLPGAQELALRQASDSVKYAGNLAIALVPQPYDQIFPAYNDFIWSMFDGIPPEESHLMSNFGTWVTTASLAVMLFGLVWHFRSRAIMRRDGIKVASDASGTSLVTLPYVAYLTMASLLFFIPWGLNYFVASLVTAQIRGWNRLAPLLLLLFIIGAAAALSEWRWARGKGPVALIAALVLLTTGLQAVLPWQGIYSLVADAGRQRVEAATAYAQDVNDALPGSCGILTLPLMFYPENGPLPPTMDDYDHAIIGMTNPEKPLSYGALRDTPSGAWQQEYASVPSQYQIPELQAMGFCGLHIDTAGFPEAEAVLAEATATLGPAVASSPDGRWFMFALDSASTS